MTRDDWRMDAACRSHPPELWFPDPGRKDVARLAKRICGGCPVATECAAEAERLTIQHGIWGGESKATPQPAKSDFRHPCGTEAAYRRHRHRGEKACEPCLEAKRRAYAERRANNRRQKATR